MLIIVLLAKLHLFQDQQILNTALPLILKETLIPIMLSLPHLKLMLPTLEPKAIKTSLLEKLSIQSMIQ
jgi:hypothetical protein